MDKQLFNKLKSFLKPGESMSFGYDVVHKGFEYHFDEGLQSISNELTDWMTQELAEISNYNHTVYRVSIVEEQVVLNTTVWIGGYPYEDVQSREDVLTEKIVKILLPDHDYGDVDLDSLSLSFECNIEDDKVSFEWPLESAHYEDEDDSVEIFLEPIRSNLESEFALILPDFGAGGCCDTEGTRTKDIRVDESNPSVSESGTFTLNFSEEDV